MVSWIPPVVYWLACHHNSCRGPYTGTIPDSKVHGANMGPIWVLSAPGGPHVGPMNYAIWDVISNHPSSIVDDIIWYIYCVTAIKQTLFNYNWETLEGSSVVITPLLFVMAEFTLS